MNLSIKPCFLPHQKHSFDFKERRKDGLILRIHCPKPPKEEKVCGKPQLRFTNVAFNNIGQVLVAATCKGNLYNFNFTQSKFWHLTNTNSCTFLKFNLLNEEEVFIGKNSGTISVVNVESREVVYALEGHKRPVKDVSFAKEFLCISSSVTEAIIWDLRCCIKLQVLCISTSTILKQVVFMPVSDNVLTCFNDDSIHIWKFGTFVHMKQIQPALWNKFIIKCLAFTRNGRTLVLGGYSQHLAVFLADTWDLDKTVVLPTSISAVKKIDFVSQPFDGGANRVLSILSSNGAIYFYDMQKDVILSRLVFGIEIIRYDSSYDGRYIACITTDGIASVYLLASYTIVEDKHVQQIVKVENKNKKNLGTFKKSLCALYTAKIKIGDILEIERLVAILKEYGQYPEMHRSKIWTQLLQIPYNVQQYQILSSKYTETPFQDLEKRYPMENRVLLKNLKKLLFGLKLWCPFFGEVTYLPLFAFPFVKVFQYDPLVCFEAVVTILINWCQYWFEYYPLPPINVLAMVENVFLHHDPTLLQHFTSHKVTLKIYAWSLIQTCFSEVLSSQDWLILWDHILSNEPSFLIMVTVAFSLLQKPHLMALSELQDFKVFYHKQNLINIKRLISKAYQLVDSTDELFHPRRYLENFRKLDEGVYPAFVDYPKAVVDYQKNTTELRSVTRQSATCEKELLEKTLAECEKIEEVKRKVEEHVRMKEVDRIYKNKLKEDQESLKRQTLKLNQIKQIFKDDITSPCPCRSPQANRKTFAEGCSEKNVQSQDSQVYQCKHLYYYRQFLETEYTVHTYDAKHYYKIPMRQTCHHEIDRKLNDARGKAKAVANSELYLAQLAITTGLTVLEKIITQLKAIIDECSCENKSVDKNFLTFMLEKIDLTERLIEAVLKNLPSNENSGEKIQFDVLRKKLTEFSSGTSGTSGATV